MGQETWDLISKVREEITAYEILDVKRAAFRSKQLWIQGGEISSKYYFNLEKRNFLSKTMYVVRKKDGMLMKDYSEILNIQYAFYKDLFTKDERVKFKLINQSGMTVKEHIRDESEKIISLQECYNAMMMLKQGKTPGSDGLGLLFYQCFWHVLKGPLYEVYLAAVEGGEFNPTGRRGIINLIPKKGKDDLLIKNWHPITLLNYDYKIWAKAIANRLESFAPELIGLQQTGFLKG